MGAVSGALVYLVIWWLIFFMLLPVGVHAQGEDGGEVVPGTPESAPRKPHIGKKMLAATLAAGAVWGLVYWLGTSGLLSLTG